MLGNRTKDLVIINVKPDIAKPHRQTHIQTESKDFIEHVRGGVFENQQDQHSKRDLLAMKIGMRGGTMLSSKPLSADCRAT